MRLTLSLLAAALIVFAGYDALGGPATLPAFNDGLAAPSTITVVVAHRQ